MTTLQPTHLMDFAYIIAIALFVLALKWLSSPSSIRDIPVAVA